MTPAMEEIVRLRAKNAETVPIAQTSPRLTRSRVAKLKRKIIICINETYNAILYT
jgi:hypothetical protein